MICTVCIIVVAIRKLYLVFSLLTIPTTPARRHPPWTRAPDTTSEATNRFLDHNGSHIISKTYEYQAKYWSYLTAAHCSLRLHFIRYRCVSVNGPTASAIQPLSISFRQTYGLFHKKVGSDRTTRSFAGHSLPLRKTVPFNWPENTILFSTFHTHICKNAFLNSPGKEQGKGNAPLKNYPSGPLWHRPLEQFLQA